jgi:chemotaxis family two-component system response regulator Rcp1
MKSDSRLRSIPVLILTNSEDEKAMGAAYDLLATAYIVKPGSRGEFEAIVEGIERFWLETAQLPQE